MKHKFQGWQKVKSILQDRVKEQNSWMNESQWASINALSGSIEKNGVIIADEVGMGKTRIAIELCRAVTDAGGRVAIVVPPGLAYQWQEEFSGRNEVISSDDNTLPPIIRSLWAYLQAWTQNNNSVVKPWFCENTLIVTHTFTNWRLSENSENWRWGLLPAIYADWRKTQGKNLPRGFHNNKDAFSYVKEASDAICEFVQKNKQNKIIRQTIQSIEEYEWNMELCRERLHAEGVDRPLLRKAVGLGFGVFDLIVIDEAHKNRGNGGMLNNLLNDVLLANHSARYLAMTATPVELDAEQWSDILERIGVDEQQRDICVKKAENYVNSVKQLRQIWASSTQARKEYGTASLEFRDTFSNYLLRRDKRNDQTIKKFVHETGENYDAYRQQSEIIISPETLSPNWKNALFAAEALSLLRDPNLKRLRLTIGNGHGIGTILDHVHDDEKNDRDPEQEIEKETTETPPNQARLQWWRQLLTDSLKEINIYDHPALLAVACEIEKYTERGQKVLVFGRFTKPLRALTELLNARLIVRTFLARDKKEIKPIPQEKLHEMNIKAISAAKAQLNYSNQCNEEINDWLKEQYQQLEHSRSNLRNELINHLNETLQKESVAFNLLQQIIKDEDLNNGITTLIEYAIEELSEGDSKRDYANAFERLILALHDKNNDPDVGQMGEDESTYLQWEALKKRLCDYYNISPEKGYYAITPQSRYARLLYGNTPHSTRRLLQTAFNLSNRSPEVLIAQSMVGREGLNLHKACRVVILLHPEWNPGVVEQQIGRVDRLGSRWNQEFEQWCENKIGVPPKIEIRPVIFSGTYDEHNWHVLQKRWDDLRAQLHGIVIPLSERQNLTEEQKHIVEEIDQISPNFSPC